MRSGGRPLYPGDDGAHPTKATSRPGACRFAADQSLPPPTIPSTRRASRGINQGFTYVPPSDLPQPVAARMNGPPLGLYPLGFAPRRPRARRRTPGWGQAIEHGPGTTAQLTSIDLQSGSSLVMCDLVSHVATRSSVLDVAGGVLLCSKASVRLKLAPARSSCASRTGQNGLGRAPATSASRPGLVTWPVLARWRSWRYGNVTRADNTSSARGPSPVHSS